MAARSILTVMTASPTYDLTVLDTVKSELKITGPDDDTRLLTWIKQASAVAANYCNRVFAKESLKEEFWPQREAYPWQLHGGLTDLQLARWPLAVVTSVVENGITLIEGTDFRADMTMGRLIRLDGNGYPRRWSALPIVVLYDAGYELLQTLPWDIENAVILLVKHRMHAQSRDPYLRSQNIPGVYEAQYWIAQGPGSSGALPPDVADMLDNYRVPVVA